MNEPTEREILARLESTIDWSDQGIVEHEGETLLSLDDACAYLVDAYESHAAAVDLASLTGADFLHGLTQVAELIRCDYRDMPELLPGELAQTRSEGLCVVYDDTEEMNQLVGLTDETRVRGVIAGIHIQPILTDFALITGQYDGPDAFEPKLCLVLERSNIGDFDDLNTELGVVAIPLGVGGVGLDRVIIH